jgi:hypothetical protein
MAAVRFEADLYGEAGGCIVGGTEVTAIGMRGACGTEKDREQKKCTPHSAESHDRPTTGQSQAICKSINF